MFINIVDLLVPQRLDSGELASASVGAYENSNPSKTAIVRFPADILESDSGTIIYVALLLSQKVNIHIYT